MIAAQVIRWHLCLPRAKMARPVRGCLTTRPQQEGIEEPEWDPQQEDQSDAPEGEDITDNNLDVEYEGSKPKVESVTQVKREVDPDAEYVNMDISCCGTLHQRMTPHEQYKGILCVQRAWGPNIMALRLKDMYTRIGFSPKAVKCSSESKD